MGVATMHAWALVAAVRGLCFLLLWLAMIPSAKAADVAMGIVASALATWTSVRLLPRGAGEVRLVSLLRFLPHFAWQSVQGGVDVARRALHPRMPLRPGLLVCPIGFPAGAARNEFCSIVSLMPGSVVVGEMHGAVTFHCLDTTQPIAQQMAAEEARLADVLLPGERDG